MITEPVTSSNIKAIGYDSDSCTLRIEFHSGSVYDYSPVTQDKYNNLMSAESKGKFVNSQIKSDENIKAECMNVDKEKLKKSIATKQQNQNQQVNK